MIKTINSETIFSKHTSKDKKTKLCLKSYSYVAIKLLNLKDIILLSVSETVVIKICINVNKFQIAIKVLKCFLDDGE